MRQKQIDGFYTLSSLGPTTKTAIAIAGPTDLTTYLVFTDTVYHKSNVVSLSTLYD